MTIEVLARAKINLALHVTGRHAGGYHLLDSVVAFADYGDLITVRPAHTLTLTLTGPFAASLCDTDNLVLTAARILHPSLGAQITLQKNLPVASGIGGGSADAAATLKALAQLWSLPLPPPETVLSLGADLPVCVAGQAARMQGIGEKITPINVPPLYAILVNPGIGLATKDVFNALTNRENPGLPPISDTFLPWLSAQRNDLQVPAICLAPVIATTLETLQSLPDCRLARMSGSGATCFALFTNQVKSQAAAQSLKSTNPGWWVQVTTLS